MNPLILVLIIGAVVVFFIYRKSKNNKEGTKIVSVRRSKDEVWKTIKQYLKDTRQPGVEISDSYVAKRNDIDYINQHQSRYLRNKKKEEIDIRRWQNKAIKGDRKYQPKRDLYVVCFQTKNIKTGVYNTPQAIECEVVRTKADKKNYDQKIVVNGSLDFNKEMEWIAPIRSFEVKKNAHAEKVNKKLEEKRIKKEAQAKIKKQKKAGKKNGK